ncbi:MAG: hypothetical protein GKC04_03215 [Methanomicrobiales archaeon]|nr:hypothetical protein [Methanomicrobiales archaeon]
MVDSPHEGFRARLVASLVGYLSHPDDDLRLTAVEALLMSTWDPAWTPALVVDAGGAAPIVACLSDEVDQVRNAAVQLVAILVRKGEAGLLIEAGAGKALEKLCKDPDPLIRRRAAGALEALDSGPCT